MKYRRIILIEQSFAKDLNSKQEQMAKVTNSIYFLKNRNNNFWKQSDSRKNYFFTDTYLIF